MARSGIVSRRKADVLIASGRVTVNGVIARIGKTITVNDRILCDGRAVVLPAPIIIAYYKPSGVTVTLSDSHASLTLQEKLAPLFRQYRGLIPVGRLDCDSEGLLILTNDGALAQELTHPSFEHEKEYEVRVQHSISDSDLQQLAHGIRLSEGVTAHAIVKRKDEKTFFITLHQGWKRQIRRMLETRHHEVVVLKRVRIANCVLGDMQPGTHRIIARRELFSF